MLALAAAGGGQGGGGLSAAVVAGLATVVVAAMALIGTLVTARLSRAAQDRTSEIDTRRLRLELEQENRRFDAELIERLHTEIGRLREEIERLERAGHRRAAEQAARCRAALGQLSDSLETLVTVVRDEVAEEAARDALAGADEHSMRDHGRRLTDAVDDGDDLAL